MNAPLQQWIRRAWAVVSATPAALAMAALLIGAWLAWVAWRWAGAQRAHAGWAAGVTLAMGAFDAALLALLPRLGLSFGPVGLPLLGITGVRWIGTAALAWLGRRRLRGRGAGAMVALLVLAHLGVSACEYHGLYVEPFDVGVSTIQVTTAHPLPASPLRIVQISDLHVERATQRELDVLRIVRELEPDLIALTGDYMSTSYRDDPIARRDARALFAQLEAPLGVYAVRAYYPDTPDVMAALFQGLDIRVLYDEVVPVQTEAGALYVVGIQYLTRPRDREMLAERMRLVPDGATSLLLYHTPDVIEVAAAEEVDLYLAGHTHGGQLRLPLFGALFTASTYGKRYEMGRYQMGDTTLYVSRGLGMEGMGAPRARFLCPPEVVLVEWRNP